MANTKQPETAKDDPAQWERLVAMAREVQALADAAAFERAFTTFVRAKQDPRLASHAPLALHQARLA